MMGFPSVPPGYRQYGPNTGHPNGSGAVALRRTSPVKEYVSSPPIYDRSRAALPRVLDRVIDDVVREQGPRIYDAMYLDPAVRSGLNFLRLSILAGGMDLAPAVKPKPGAKGLTPEETKAKDYVDECWRNIERIPDFESGFLFDILTAMKDGSRLAQPVFELASTGPDAGKLVFRAMKVKPYVSWKFHVDPFMNVVGIEVRDVDNTEVILDPESFVWLTWDMQDSDPRGQSLLKSANSPWNLKYINIPEYRTYLRQFASGIVTGTTEPGAMPTVAPDPTTGAVDPAGTPVDPQWRMMQSLTNMCNGSVHVGPYDSAVNIVFPSGEGSPFTAAFDWSDRQIHLALLGTTSATLEAVHDSRAKGETGKDVVGMVTELGRKLLSSFVRRILHMLITLNHGDEEATEFTPLVTFGQADAPDRPALWGAASGLGLQLGASQIAEVCQMIGLPIPDLEADEAKAKQKAAEAMEQQRAMKEEVPPKPGGSPPGVVVPKEEKKEAANA